MCDINVFVFRNGAEEKIMENVDIVSEVSGGIQLVNIFGEEQIIRGKMVYYNNSEKRMVFKPI